MNVFRLIMSEFASIVKNKKILIPVIAVLLVPLLYSGMFLWAFWDPYDKLNELPVAVVNMDEGAVIDGEQVNVGNELIDSLKENDNFKWSFITQKEAVEGLDNLDYYMTVEIPKDFSLNASTVLDKEPKPLELNYIPNEGYNFLSAQIGNTAVEKIKNEIANSITEKYAKLIFDKVDTLSDGLEKAANGSKEITDGMQKVYDGTNELLNGLTNKTKDVTALVNGTKQLESGSAELKNGISKSLTGTKEIQNGSSKLVNGTQQLQVGAQQFNAKMTEFQKGSAKAAQGSQQLSDGLKYYFATHPELQADPQLQKLVGMSQVVANGVNEVSSSTGKLSVGAKTIESKLSEVVAGQKSLNQGLATLTNGQTQLLSGATSLNNGLKEATTGVTTLSNGWNTIKSSVKELSDGEKKVLDGNNELTKKLNDAVIETNEVQVGDKNFEMIANPVNLAVEHKNEVPNYGTGFSPYFISLGLFVGALLLSIVFDMRKFSFKAKSGFGVFLSKFSVLALVSLFQSMFVGFFVLNVLGLEVKSVSYFLGFCLLVSLTFMTLIQLLVSVFADAGRFIAIVILILQLTSSAGTFPLELLPHSLQGFYDWLPMSYTVLGYKSLISTGDFSLAWDNAKTLFIFAGSFVALTWTYIAIKLRIKRKNENQESEVVS